MKNYTKMLVYKVLLVCLVVCSVSCVSAQKSYQMSTGEVQAIVISRGSFQYLVKIGDHAYMPKTLSDEFKQDGLKVKITYKVLDKKAKVFKPSATDVPEVDYEVNEIEIKQIKIAQ